MITPAEQDDACLVQERDLTQFLELFVFFIRKVAACYKRIKSPCWVVKIVDLW